MEYTDIPAKLDELMQNGLNLADLDKVRENYANGKMADEDVILDITVILAFLPLSPEQDEMGLHVTFAYVTGNTYNPATWA